MPGLVRQPRFAVAMCTYNGGRYLPQQLDSILRQTRQPDEMVVCDDGSADTTLHLIEQFARKAGFPVTVVRNAVNLHYTGNFMKAASLCSADWVLFCDQDDTWLPTKIEQLGRILGSDVDLGMHEGVVVDAADRPTGQTLPHLTNVDLASDDPLFDTARGFAMAVKRHIIDEMLSQWDWDRYMAFRSLHGSPLGHDALIWAWCRDRKVVLVREPLVRYRVHDANLTVTHGSTGPWAVRQVHRMRMLQFGASTYLDSARRRSAEAEFVDCMFPHAPRQVTRLRDHLWELASLNQARADVHDVTSSWWDRVGAWRSLLRLNGQLTLTAPLPRTALLKDLVLGLGKPSAWRRGTTQRIGTGPS